MTQMIMKIPAREAVSYPVTVGSDLLLHPEKWLPADCHQKRIVIIADDTVSTIYGKKLINALHSYHPLLLSFLPGEQSKNYQIKHSLEEQMLQSHCNRDTVILALGGGVTGDLAGFIAATYMRGIACIQIPTTLLSMIDSSVGGKTGINTNQGKNLIGAFWQPISVVADLQCLLTLPDVQIINGLIEAIKIFLTNDLNYFNYTDNHIDKILQRDLSVIHKIVERAIQLKMDIVSQDERESGPRMILNFGHTIGHALEKISDYTVLHGYAVALGILVEAKISELSGLLSAEGYQTIRSILLKLNISSATLKNFNPDDIIQATKTDKKMKSDAVRYVLLKKLGQAHIENTVFSYPVSDDMVRKALLDTVEV